MDGIPSLLSSTPGMLSYMNGIDKQRSPWKEKLAFEKSHFFFPFYCNVLHNHASEMVLLTRLCLLLLKEGSLCVLQALCTENASACGHSRRTTSQVERGVQTANRK